MNDIIMLKCFIEIKNYLIEEINQSELMSKKHKKVCRALHYTDHLLIATITITGRVSISAFASLVVFLRIASSTIGLKIIVITAGIKTCKSIIKKRRKSILK